MPKQPGNQVNKGNAKKAKSGALGAGNAGNAPNAALMAAAVPTGLGPLYRVKEMKAALAAQPANVAMVAGPVFSLGKAPSKNKTKKGGKRRVTRKRSTRSKRQ